MSASKEIPIIDVAAMVATLSDDSIADVARQMNEACRGSGFFYLSNHGIPQPVIDRAFAEHRKFHALPLEEKLKLKRNQWHRGYVAEGGNIARASARFEAAKLPNRLESFGIRHEVPENHPDYKRRPLQGPNQWPDDPAFKEGVLAYINALRDLGMKLLRPMAVAMGEDREFFVPFFSPPCTNLRMLHYPPAPPMNPDGRFGIHPHTDYGFLTLLAQDTTGGLQVRRPDGSWIEATPVPGTLVINVGDMLARWANDVFNSTPHRVISPAVSTDRYSMAMFFDPNLDSMIQTRPQFVEAGQQPKYETINWGEYYARSLDSNFDRAGVTAATTPNS
jgi:isopenicillin N synthase-like dioxygenase